VANTPPRWKNKVLTRIDANCCNARWQLDEDKLAVHRDVLKITAVGQNEIGVEFKPTFAETFEHTDDLFFWE